VKWIRFCGSGLDRGEAGVAAVGRRRTRRRRGGRRGGRPAAASTEGRRASLRSGGRARGRQHEASVVAAATFSATTSMEMGGGLRPAAMSMGNAGTAAAGRGRRAPSTSRRWPAPAVCFRTMAAAGRWVAGATSGGMLSLGSEGGATAAPAPPQAACCLTGDLVGVCGG
jgi:hypothetical protein